MSLPSFLAGLVVGLVLGGTTSALMVFALVGSTRRDQERGGD